MRYSSGQIGKKTVNNAIWLYLQRIVIKSLNLISVAILARKLSPSDFGVVAIAGVLLSFIVLSTTSTVGPYVINNKEIDSDEHDHAAFWFNLTFALVIVLIYWTLIPTLKQFYEQPLLEPVLYVLSIKLLFTQLSVVPDSIIRRHMDYKKLVFRDSLLSFFSVSVSIVMALTGFGVWSLIIPDLIVTIPRFLLVMYMSKWKPKLPFRFPLWKHIFNYSKYVIGSTLLGGLINDGDTLILGKIAGTQQLAFYDRSWRTANLVSSNVVSVVGDISQPAFSALYRTPERLQNAYKKTVRSISLISFPLLIGMFVLADDFILTIYGPKWTSSILLLRIFIVFAIQRSVFSTTGSIYNVMNRPDIGFKLNLIQVPFYFAAIFIGNIYGIVGITIGVTLIRTIFGFITMHLSCKVIQISTSKALRSLIPSLLISLLMGVILYITRKLISPLFPVPPISNLLIYTLLGTIIYIILLVSFFPDLLNEIINIIGNLSEKSAVYLKRIFKKRLLRAQSSDFDQET